MKMLTVNDAINALRTSKDYKEFTFKLLREVKLVDAIPIPDNATNGDMIKAMFSSMNVQERNNVTLGIKGQTIEFTGMALKEWWNAQYKKMEEQHE